MPKQTLRNLRKLADTIAHHEAEVEAMPAGATKALAESLLQLYPIAAVKVLSADDESA